MHNAHLKQLEKEEMKNPRVSRRKEILNIRAEINAKETKEIAEQSQENVHTVQTQIYRARDKLKKSFRKELLKE